MRLQQRSKPKSVFKMNDDLDRSYRMLFGPEETEPYGKRLKKSAMRVIQGDAKPLTCCDCGMDDVALIEIHHLLDDDSGMTGNDWREIHGVGNEFYRYLLNPDVVKPKVVILCPTCHKRRHLVGRKLDKTDYDYQQEKGRGIR